MENYKYFHIKKTKLFILYYILIFMGGPKFQKDEVSNESELHQIMIDDIEALEEGIKILKHEFQCGNRGVADFLYADSGNRLGIIEVKKDTDENFKSAYSL